MLVRECDLKYYDELCHSGVKGMKWGHRKAVVTSGGASSGRQKSKGMSADKKAKIKTAAKVGAYVAASALLAYGGYKMTQLQGARSSAQAAAFNRSCEQGRSVANSLLKNNLSSSASNLSAANSMNAINNIDKGLRTLR